jgi:hypothetical protein
VAEGAEAWLDVEVSATAKLSAADRQSVRVGHLMSKKWLIVAVAAGAAAAGGVAAASGKGGTGAAASQSAYASVTTTVGTPTIIIRKP